MYFIKYFSRCRDYNYYNHESIGMFSIKDSNKRSKEKTLSFFLSLI